MEEGIHIQSLYEKLVYLFIFLMVLPSDDLFDVPIKPIFIIILTFMLVYLYVKKKIKFEKIYWFAVITLLSLAVWTVIGFINSYRVDAILQLRAFLSLLGTVLIIYASISNHLIDAVKAKKMIYLVMFGKIISKVVIELLVITHVMNDSVYHFVYDFVLKAGNTTLSVPGFHLFRINTANDALVLAVLGFYLIDKEISRRSKAAVLLLATYFVLIVYSRVFFAQYILLLGIVFLITLFESKERKKIAISCASVTVILFACVMLNVANVKSHINAAIYDRFSSQGTQISDSIRSIQQIYLTEDIKKSPVVGRGIGAYDKRIIRSEVNKFSYEKEYYALMMQLGIVGFILIICSIIFLCFAFLQAWKIRDKIIMWLILLNFGLWIIKPIYNPGLISNASASIIAALIIFSFFELRTKKELSV